MGNKKISALTELTEAPATTDVVPVVDVSDTTGASTGTTKKVSLTNLSAGIVDISTSQLDAASLVTESEGISSNDNDTTLPTSAAVKDYVDTQILTKDNLDEIAEGTTNKHFTAADETKLDGIEDSADVTDTANVTAAGALMDSELTDLAGVKGVTISTLQEKPSEGAFVDGDKTKLDGLVSNVTHTGDVTGSTALTIASGAVQTDMIAGGAITQIKIANDSIGSGQIGANAVGASELADDAVDTAAIVDDAVTGAKLNAALNDLSNVNASPSNNQILKWNSTSSNWEAGDDSGAASGTVTGVTGTSPISSDGSSTTPAISIDDASTSAKGAASFSPDNFAVSSGAVSIKSAGVDLTDEVTGSLPDGNIASAATWNAKIADVVSDTTPQLGGDLDVNSNKIITASGSNGDIVLNPDGTGNVGIGEPNPSFGLDVSGTMFTGADDQGINVHGSTTGIAMVRAVNRANDTYKKAAFDATEYDFLVSGTSKVAIDSAGRCGIGTSSPNTNVKLEVAGPIRASSTSRIEADVLNSGDNTANIILRSGTNTLVGNGNYLYVTDAGNLLAGGTSVANCYNGNGDAKPFVFQGTDSGTTVTHANNLLCIVNDDDTTGNMSGVAFGWTDADESPHYLSASINCVMGEAVSISGAGQYRSGDLAFLTSNATNSAPTEKMRLDADGTLDLKSEKLKLNGSGGSADQVLKTDGSGNVSWSALPVELGFAVSDETTALTTGTAKITFRMPHAMTLTAVRANVVTAPAGSALTVDINEGGSTILSTKLTIDAGEKTSTTATTAVGISSSSLADDAEITVDIDAIGSSTAGAGLKIWLIGTRA